jgi:hypothetical protein
MHLASATIADTGERNVAPWRASDRAELDLGVASREDAGRRVGQEVVRHRPLADPPGMKLLALRRQGYFGTAVGKEVGFSMVRKSP